MVSTHRIFHDRRLLVLLGLLLSIGFIATTLSSYLVSRAAIREAIVSQELPLAASNIYAGIQKDLVRPVLVSSTMAHDTFLREWVLGGEREVGAVVRYLEEVKTRYGAFSSFFVSERTQNYYTGAGVLKKVAPTEPRDAWYYRVRDLQQPYEINVDPDMANRDAMTIFINYRVFDFNGQYIGATGVGLTIDAVHRLIRDYQQRYQRTIYFVDTRGQVVLSGGSDNGVSTQGQDLRQRAGLAELVDTILKEQNGAYEYQAGGSRRLLNVHAIPELHWYLFVEKDETEALAEIRHTLYLNLLACLGVTLVVLVLAHQTLRRYQQRMETLASTDELTGLLNRRAFTFLIDKFLADYQREPRPMAMLLIDVDHFKSINDHHGHVAGDLMLAHVASLMQRSLRRSDLAVRWGGEEFLVVLKGCDLVEAGLLAEKLRQTVEQDRYVLRNEAIRMTVSIGVSEFSGNEAPDQAINRADLALYEAKRSGRNCVRTTGLPQG